MQSAIDLVDPGNVRLDFCQIAATASGDDSSAAHINEIDAGEKPTLQAPGQVGQGSINQSREGLILDCEQCQSSYWHSMSSMGNTLEVCV